MKAVILCPGPSLAKYQQHRNDADIFICVNRAAKDFHCDYWAALDHTLVGECIDQIKGRFDSGLPKLITSFDTPRLMEKLPGKPYWRGDIITHDRLLLWHDQGATNYCLYTATMALVAAAYLRCSRIFVYGSDLTGAVDSAGVANEQGRSPERWAKEQGIIQKVCGELLERGVWTTYVPL